MAVVALILVLVPMAYLLGTFPSAELVARRYGVDVTKEGSGNPGASNVVRLLGWKAGALVLVLDAAKGAIAAGAGLAIDGHRGAWILGVAAVIGHVFPVWKKFKGGRGVATGAGVFLVVYPLVTIALAIVWVAIARGLHKASVASLTVAVAAPVIVVVVGGAPLDIAVVVGVAVLLVARHASNLRRLFRGEEHGIGSQPASDPASPGEPAADAPPDPVRPDAAGRGGLVRPLRVAVSDLWTSGNPDELFLVRALRKTTPAEVVAPADAELLLFSVFGTGHAGFVGTKVEYTGENTRPHWSAADFSIGSDLLDDSRYLRYPFFAVTAYADEVGRVYDEPVPAWSDREFCLFLTSHPTEERRRVFEALARYREPTSPGGFLRNVEGPAVEPMSGDWRGSKHRYQRRFRFSVAFENSSYPGYTTEKLTDALVTQSIPIYWGNPQVALDVRPECFIDAADFPDLDALTEYVRAVDNDEALAAQYLGRPDYLVRSGHEYWQDLVAFLGEVAASVGTRSKADERRRARRLKVTSVGTNTRKTARLARNAVGRRWSAVRSR